MRWHEATWSNKKEHEAKLVNLYSDKRNTDKSWTSLASNQGLTHLLFCWAIEHSIYSVFSVGHFFKFIRFARMTFEKCLNIITCAAQRETTFPEDSRRYYVITSQKLYYGRVMFFDTMSTGNNAKLNMPLSQNQTQMAMIKLKKVPRSRRLRNIFYISTCTLLVPQSVSIYWDKESVRLNEYKQVHVRQYEVCDVQVYYTGKIRVSFV